MLKIAYQLRAWEEPDRQLSVIVGLKTKSIQRLCLYLNNYQTSSRISLHFLTSNFKALTVMIIMRQLRAWEDTGRLLLVTVALKAKSLWRPHLFWENYQKASRIILQYPRSWIIMHIICERVNIRRLTWTLLTEGGGRFLGLSRVFLFEKVFWRKP